MKKNERGIGWNLRTSGVDETCKSSISDVPVSRNWYETVPKLNQNLHIRFA